MQKQDSIFHLSSFITLRGHYHYHNRGRILAFPFGNLMNNAVELSSRSNKILEEINEADHDPVANTVMLKHGSRGIHIEAWMPRFMREQRYDSIPFRDRSRMQRQRVLQGRVQEHDEPPEAVLGVHQARSPRVLHRQEDSLTDAERLPYKLLYGHRDSCWGDHQPQLAFPLLEPLQQTSHHWLWERGSSARLWWYSNHFFWRLCPHLWASHPELQRCQLLPDYGAFAVRRA